MGSPQTTVALVLAVAVMFLAPTLVGALVVGGLVRIVRERDRETRPVELETQSVETVRVSMTNDRASVEPTVAAEVGEQHDTPMK